MAKQDKIRCFTGHCPCWTTNFHQWPSRLGQLLGHTPLCSWLSPIPTNQRTEGCYLLQQDLTALEEWDMANGLPSVKVHCHQDSSTTKAAASDHQLHGQTLQIADSSKYWESPSQLLSGEDVSNRSLERAIEPSASLGGTWLFYPSEDHLHSNGPTSHKYTSTVLDPVSQKHIQTEQVRQRAARYVFNNYTDRKPGCVTQMVKDLKWESVADRRTNRLYMYRISHNLVDLVDINPYTYLQDSDRWTKGLTWFFQGRTEFPGYRNFFYPRTIWDWNSLPYTVTEASALEGFRHLLPIQPSLSSHRFNLRLNHHFNL